MLTVFLTSDYQTIAVYLRPDTSLGAPIMTLVGLYVELFMRLIYYKMESTAGIDFLIFRTERYYATGFSTGSRLFKPSL